MSNLKMAIFLADWSDCNDNLIHLLLSIRQYFLMDLQACTQGRLIKGCVQYMNPPPPAMGRKDARLSGKTP